MNTNQLDAYIAEHLFKLPDLRMDDNLGYVYTHWVVVSGVTKEIPSYSSKIQDAFLVIEKMDQECFGIEITNDTYSRYKWMARFVTVDSIAHNGFSDNLAEAICLAAKTYLEYIKNQGKK